MERQNKHILQGPDPMAFWVIQLNRERKKKRNHNRGFSLVELIIVIAIMAILAASIAPALIRYINKSRKAVDVQTAKVIFDAVNLALSESEVPMSVRNGSGAIYDDYDPYVSFYTYTYGRGGSHYEFDRMIDGVTHRFIIVARTNYYKMTANGKYQPENGSNLSHHSKGSELRFMNGGASESDAFLDVMNSFIPFGDIKVKYKMKSDLGTFNRYFICYDKNSLAISIWIGPENTSSAMLPLLLQLYPDTDPEYLE